MNKNYAEVIGNLGATPELRFTKQGTAVCDLRVATNDRYTDSNGDKQTDTQWHRVVVWGKQAEICCQYLTKGRQVRVEGKLRNTKWDDKEGVTHYTTEIRARSVDFGAAPQGQQEAPAEAPSTPEHRGVQF